MLAVVEESIGSDSFRTASTSWSHEKKTSQKTSFFHGSPEGRRVEPKEVRRSEGFVRKSTNPDTEKRRAILRMAREALSSPQSQA